jgi:hypothetical protein
MSGWQVCWDLTVQPSLYRGAAARVAQQPVAPRAHHRHAPGLPAAGEAVHLELPVRAHLI